MVCNFRTTFNHDFVLNKGDNNNTLKLKHLIILK